MPLLIPDETLADLHLSEHEARIEIACRLFEAGKLTKAQAGRLAGLDRIAFEDHLKARGIPAYRIDEEYLREEEKALAKWDTLP